MEKDDKTLEEGLVDLPMGRPHVSFSELNDWAGCSYRHMLKHIKKINIDRPSYALVFGKSMHALIEQYVSTKTMNVDATLASMKDAWDADGFEQQLPYEEARTAIVNMVEELPRFLDAQFEGWQSVGAEIRLYERIERHPMHRFKGFVDVIIKVSHKGKDLFWIIDAKTTSWGWNAQKRSDPMVKAQLVLYKNYWCAANNVDPRQVRCAFLLLKRTVKPGHVCELVPVSVGNVTTRRVLSVIDNMISCVKKGIALKNRDACKWCEFKDTEHCR